MPQLRSLAICLLLFGLTTGARAADEIQVLFIGNSFTYVHDLPKMLDELAKAGGQPKLKLERETPGGYTLEKHWADGKALRKIQSRHWAYVVLQENSQYPLKNRESMFAFAKKFDSAIKTQGAKTLLYMTWSDLTKPEDQAGISKAYQDLAGELKAQLAPVGDAWQAAQADDKQLMLHDKDKHHPSATGTYLSACVFYATLFDKSPEGLPGKIANLSAEQSRELQSLAWKTVHGK